MYYGGQEFFDFVCGGGHYIRRLKAFFGGGSCQISNAEFFGSDFWIVARAKSRGVIIQPFLLEISKYQSTIRTLSKKLVTNDHS